MADNNTKQKILTTSIELFNKHGLANVRLLQIANELGISPGNLAYHFRNKEALIEAISEEIREAATGILAAYRQYPNLLDFDHQLNSYFGFVQEYPTFFIDLLEVQRQFPEIFHPWQHLIAKMISQLRRRFDYNQQRGIIRKARWPGEYERVADTIWQLIVFWVPTHFLRGQQESLCPATFKGAVWQQISPYFTEAGWAEFEQLIRPTLEEEDGG